MENRCEDCPYPKVACDEMQARFCREATAEHDAEIIRIMAGIPPGVANTEVGGSLDSEWGVREWN